MFSRLFFFKPEEKCKQEEKTIPDAGLQGFLSVPLYKNSIKILVKKCACVLHVHARTQAREIRSPIQILSGLLIGAARLESTAESQSMGITYTHSPKETGSFFIYCRRSRKCLPHFRPLSTQFVQKAFLQGGVPFILRVGSERLALLRSGVLQRSR